MSNNKSNNFFCLFQKYSDGITNKLLGIWYTEFSDQLLLRIYGENTEAFINRDSEKNNMKVKQNLMLIFSYFKLINFYLAFDFFLFETRT